jgi:cytochrome c oxidase subunit II
MNALPWPGEISAHAASVDWLFVSLALLMLALSAPVFILTIVFAVKYRRGKPANRRHAPGRNVWIEVSWAGIPFLLLLVFYVQATGLFADLYHPPANALEIEAVGKQWMWKFQHPEGQQEINELHVPAGMPVKITMASQDVIHSLFIPALRIKQDVVPGRYTHLWFQADQPGSYQLLCAEFCGTNHSLMGGHFIVMTLGDYGTWLQRSKVDDTLAAQGAALFRDKGCSGCHSPAATVHAPPLEGLFGSNVPLQNGTMVLADAQYIRDSILLPQAQIAAGYPPIMPTYQNQLGEDEVLKLVAYVESLGTARETK